MLFFFSKDPKCRPISSETSLLGVTSIGRVNRQLEWKYTDQIICKIWYLIGLRCENWLKYYFSVFSSYGIHYVIWLKWKNCNLIVYWCFSYLKALHVFSVVCRFFSKLTLKSFKKIIRGLYSWDPDQARHLVRPDLGSNCLQRLSADNKCGH